MAGGGTKRGGVFAGRLQPGSTRKKGADSLPQKCEDCHRLGSKFKKTKTQQETGIRRWSGRRASEVGKMNNGRKSDRSVAFGSSIQANPYANQEQKERGAIKGRVNAFLPWRRKIESRKEGEPEIRGTRSKMGHRREFARRNGKKHYLTVQKE